jgi:hypothetical protein
MATNCPPQVASRYESHQEADPGPAPSASRALSLEGLTAGLMSTVGQLLCGMSGHEAVVQFEPERLYLKCISCGHQSPGWSLPRRRPISRREDGRRPHHTAPVQQMRRVA